jgi:hypothetical protein
MTITVVKGNPTLGFIKGVVYPVESVEATGRGLCVKVRLTDRLTTLYGGRRAAEY